jgi:hypothetical protein
MVKTMDAALERFTDNLKRVEQEKIMQHEDFNWRVQAEKELIDLEHSKVKELQARNYIELASQIH